jgi:hypothetical protein
MTESSHSLQQAKLLVSMSNATRTLALQRAMWAWITVSITGLR